MQTTQLKTTQLGSHWPRDHSRRIRARAGSAVEGSPAVDGALAGFRRADRVGPIPIAANLELSDEDAAELEGSTR